MRNEEIAEYFALLGKLMDIHGENSFKSKTYANAAFQIDRLTEQLTDTPKNSWAALRGIGVNMAAKIEELVTNGNLKALSDYIEKTPEGVMEMLGIKGLGPKKIYTIWKEMGIESVGELLYACNENRLTLYKGFGAKTQNNVRDAILFMMAQQGKFLYQQAEPFIENYQQKLQSVFPGLPISITGAVRTHDEIVTQIDFLIHLPLPQLLEGMQTIGHTPKEQNDENILFQLEQSPSICLHTCTFNNLGSRQMLLTGNYEFITYIENKLNKSLPSFECATEDEIFAKAGMEFIQPEQRAIAVNETFYQTFHKKKQVTNTSIKGIIHSHSQWSDGSDSLEAMAKAAINNGLEYLVISDHSQAASYAGGLRPEKIIEQHIEIDRLNESLAPFKIFKSIECDILGNGQLDYDDDILQSLDLVIASIHSTLKMREERAMQRLITAIENPYTLILGHMTGRLLLSRNGYPLDHKKIIDACAANNVVIELNAHPRRLDIDWRWIPYALEKDVLISINPDAHSIEGFGDTRYGVLAAQKALLPAASNLSSFSLHEFEEWLYDTRRMKGTI
jgi:DNA polymerase (family 10)